MSGPDKPAVDEELIRDSLARLLDETGLTEIEIERDGLRVRVARQVLRSRAPFAIAAAESQRPVAAVINAHAAAADPAEHPGVVTSPMVGTAYRAPEPGAKAVRRGRQRRQGGRDAADHRGDEDDEPDSRAARRAP